jgi:hypothetical protein
MADQPAGTVKVSSPAPKVAWAAFTTWLSAEEVLVA